MSILSARGPALRVTVFIAALAPFLSLVWAAFNNQLGPDPGEAVMQVSGDWAIRLLVITLMVSPLRKWLAWPRLASYRRMFGLFCFFYASVHLLAFAHFYSGWSIELLWTEFSERPYISAGILGWLIMLPLAITSTRGMQRRLRRRWVELHRGVYGVAVLACVHLIWQTRSDFGEALVYSVLFFALLSWRVSRRLQRPSATAS